MPRYKLLAKPFRVLNCYMSLGKAFDRSEFDQRSPHSRISNSLRRRSYTASQACGRS